MRSRSEAILQPKQKVRVTSESLIFEPSDHERGSALFGRRRLFGMMGATLFGGVATMMVQASPAYAAACGTNWSIDPCFGYPLCNCCSAHNCCAQGCTAAYLGCPGDETYWYRCSNGYYFACADFCQTCTGGSQGGCPDGKAACLCRFYIGTC